MQRTIVRYRVQIALLDLFDLIAFLVFVTGVILFIRFFIFNPYTVVGQSMEPLFHQGDFIVVDKITPRIGSLQRGDIIVFVPESRDVPFIKRVIGLPGEKVVIRDNNVLICSGSGSTENCTRTEEFYLPMGTITSTSICKKDTFQVDDDGYFVMGDNRSQSTDSRCCFWLGCFENSNYLVHPQDIIGKVALKVFPELQGFR